MLPEDALPGECELWPENAMAVSIFCDMGTQWRVGMSGATGLDYAALEMVMRTRRVPRSERWDLFDSLRIMEREVLKMNAETNG